MTSHAAFDLVNGVDALSAIPLYRQIETILRARITRGEWKPGEQIPTESQLCDTYNVSRVTVRQALARLTRDGILTRGRGKGTFVREPRLTAAARSVSSFSTEMRQLGMTAGSRILGIDTVHASEDIGPEMMLADGTPLWRLRRLRTADAQPIGIQTTLLVADRCPGLERFVSDGMSLYELLKQKYGIVPVDATEIFTVSGVPRNQTALLDVAQGSHAFQVTRVTYDGQGVFEHTTSILRGDRYQIRIALHNQR